MKFLRKILVLVGIVLAMFGCTGTKKNVKNETVKKFPVTFVFDEDWFIAKPTSEEWGNVYIAGSFNGWKYKNNPLKRNGTKWEITLNLKPRVYQYKFVFEVKGSSEPTWTHDLDSLDVKLNEFMNFNSIVRVNKDGSIRKKDYYDKVVESDMFIYYYRSKDFKDSGNTFAEYKNRCETQSKKILDFLELPKPDYKIKLFLIKGHGTQFTTTIFAHIYLPGAPNFDDRFENEFVHSVFITAEESFNYGIARYIDSIFIYKDNIDKFAFFLPLDLEAKQYLNTGLAKSVDYYVKNPLRFWNTKNQFVSIPYALISSFTKYIVEKYGLAKFKEFAETGDFKSVYDKDIPAVEKEWMKYINNIKSTEDEKLATEYFELSYTGYAIYTLLTGTDRKEFLSEAQSGYLFNASEYLEKKDGKIIAKNKKELKKKLAKLRKWLEPKKELFKKE